MENHYVSWHYLQGQEEASSEDICWDVCIDNVKILWHNTDERSLNYAVASK
jgi:hypothetical protein